MVGFIQKELDHPFIAAKRSSGVGVRIIYSPEMVSTNSTALDLIQCEVENGTVVITDFQIQGRGRGENNWSAIPGAGLTFSVILYPHLPVTYAGFTSLLAGVAIAEALQKSDIQLTLKWPNDIFLEGGKLGGILCESHVQHARLNSIVLGIGLNINEKKNQFPTDLRELAVSLFTVYGRQFDRVRLLKDILESLDAWVNTWAKGATGKIIKAWSEKCRHLGEQVKFRSGDRWVEGIFKGLSEHGEAVLGTETGDRLYSGSDLQIM